MRRLLLAILVFCLSCSDNDPLADVRCHQDTNCPAGYVCSDDGVCVPACETDADCEDNNPCTQDSCEKGTGCINPPVGNGLVCDDGIDCTEGDGCWDGVCTGIPKDAICDDGNGCTDDRCHPESGCAHPANADACDDGNPCTQADMCSEGDCGPGVYLGDGAECDSDNNGATREVCIERTCTISFCGDGFVDAAIEDCDDGNTEDNDGCEGDCRIVPPAVVIDFPVRGDTVVTSGEVVVLGTVEAGSTALQSLLVNGEAVSVESDGSFSHTVAAAHGLNHVDVIATNTAGRSDRKTAGYYASTAFLATSNGQERDLRNREGWLTRLGQEAIDDFDHPCATDSEGRYICDEVDDLATIGEIILNDLDIEGDLIDLAVYQQSFPIFEQRWPFESGALDILGSEIGVRGDLALTGVVHVESRVTELDFNNLGLTLTSRAGGLDGVVEISELGATPGFRINIRTTAVLDAGLGFDPVQLTVDGDDSSALACLILDTLAGLTWASTVCPDSEGDYAPVAGLDPNAYADSDASVGALVLDTGFDISLDAGGELRVSLVRGDVDLLGSTIDVNPITDLQLDLGSVSVLGGTFEFALGTVDLNEIAVGLDGFLGPLLDAITGDLQMLLEAGIDVLLLNESDPLNVASVLETAVLRLAVNGPVSVPALGSTASPALDLHSHVSSVGFSAYDGSALHTGGMVVGLATGFSVAEAVETRALGSILRGDCVTEDPFGFVADHPLEKAEHVDAINQVLFADWLGGAWQTEVSSEELDVSLLAKAAPILEGCHEDGLWLQLADLRVAGEVDGEEVEAFVSVSVPVLLGIDSGRWLLREDDTRDPWSSSETLGGQGPALGSDLELLAAAQAAVVHANAAMLATPELEFDLIDLASQDGVVLNLAAETVENRSGYLVRSGAVAR